MRWFLLIVVVIWLLAAMTTTVVVIYLTKSLLSLSLFSTLAPPVYILYRITKFLSPKSEGDYQLEAMKIQYIAERQLRNAKSASN